MPPGIPGDMSGARSSHLPGTLSVRGDAAVDILCGSQVRYRTENQLSEQCMGAAYTCPQNYFFWDHPLGKD